MGVTAKSILEYAISQIGVKESPAGSNKVKYNTWYYGKEVSGSVYPWCAAFVNYVFYKCNASNLFCGGSKSAYCPTIENYYKSIGAYYSKSNGKPGDLCIMDFGKGRASHIGIVEKKNSNGTYTVIEGNTSTSSNDNGGCVMRRTRGTGVIRGFCRPKYDTESAHKAETKDNTYIAKKGKVVTKSTSLNIRNLADSNSKKVGTLQKGEIVEIIGESGNWYKIHNGYVSKDYIEIITEDTKYGIITAKSGLRLRKGKSTKSTILTTIPYNSKVEILSKEGNWFKVSYKNITGYCSSTYVKV